MGKDDTFNKKLLLSIYRGPGPWVAGGNILLSE